MRHVPILFLILVAAAPATRPAARPAAAPAVPLRVLFVGNSYTSVNDLPTVFRKVAAGGGRPAPLVDAVVPGGKTLLQHLSDPATLDKIDAGYGPRHLPWDVVILQEQSQTPAFAEIDPRMRDGFLSGAVGLYDRVKQKNPAARVVLYETWARHPDQWKNADEPTRQLGADAADMQARLRKWYAAAAGHIAKESKAERKDDVAVAPAGDAWEVYLRDAKAATRLHAADNSHPTYAGTYLAALAIYQTVYQPETLAVRERGTLKEAEAKDLQRAATTATTKDAGEPATRPAAARPAR